MMGAKKKQVNCLAVFWGLLGLCLLIFSSSCAEPSKDLADFFDFCVLRDSPQQEGKLLVQIELEHRFSEYYSHIEIGGKKFMTVVDTGSADLVLHGDSALCSNCNEVNRFTRANGKLVSENPIALHYGSGSAQALTFNASVGFACKKNLVDMNLGVLTSSDGVPAIWGLAKSKLGQIDGANLFQSMVNSGQVADVFSMVLCGRRIGSELVLGGEPPGQTGALTTIPYDDAGGFYRVSVRKFRFNDEVITIESQGFVDSGTTKLVVPPSVLNPFKEQLKPILNAHNKPIGFLDASSPSDAAYKVEFTEAQIREFPDFTVELLTDGGEVFQVAISADDYLLPVAHDGVVRVFGVRSHGDMLILGQPFMESGTFVFDRVNKKIKIGSLDGLCGG